MKWAIFLMFLLAAVWNTMRGNYNVAGMFAIGLVVLLVQA